VQGVQGITGVQGAQGPIGSTGVQGPAGITGVQGAQGAQGPTGLLGVSLTHSVSIGAGGYFKIGSGTKDSTLSGIQIDDTEFVGQLTGVDQVVIGTDGSIIAGGGEVAVDAEGISILNSGALRFIDAANEFSLYASGAGLYIDALQSSSLFFGASSGGAWGNIFTNYARIADAYSRFNGLKVTSGGIAISDPTTGEIFTLGDARIGGGLYVGDSTAATDPPAGDILTSGGIHIGGTDDPGNDNLIVDGTAYIGDTANAKMTQGITINQGANDDEILALKSSDVAHGVTTVTETDTFASFTKNQGAYGGLRITALTDAGATYDEALYLLGITGDSPSTDKTTSAGAGVILAASKANGTGQQVVGANSNLVAIRNFGTTRFLFDAEGSAHADVEWTTFDDYDDVVLLTDLERAMLAQRDPVKASFVDFLQYNHEALENAGVVHFDHNNLGHAMVNTTKLSMALVGAIRQMSARLNEIESRMLTG
jgi:hypothetical protein